MQNTTSEAAQERCTVVRPIQKLIGQEGQHPLTGQRVPPISGMAGLIGDEGL